MKRIRQPLELVFDVPDDTDTIFLSQQLPEALEALRAIGLVSTSYHRITVEPLEEHVCRVGPHMFVRPPWFPADRPLPDICREHADQQQHLSVMDEHAPLFDEVRRLSEGKLVPQIWHSGGGTMTIVIPLTEPAPGEEWTYPLYMGLKEGEDEETGEWGGGFSFYINEEADQDGQGPNSDVPMPNETPQGWAAGIVAHWRKLTGPQE